MKFVYFLFLLFCSVTFAQQYQECKLAQDNLLWRNKFENAKSLSEKVSLIKYKIEYDSSFIEKDTVWNSSYEAARVHVSTEGGGQPLICVFTDTMIQDKDGNICCPKIYFIITGKKLFLEIDLDKYPFQTWICEELSADKIFKIELLESEKANAFGSYFSEGIAIIRLKDKKFIKKIKKYLSKQTATSP